MRKTKLLLAACAAMFAMQTISAGELEDGTYYFKNVGKQKFLAAGDSWGTHAVVNNDGLDYIVKKTDGKYTLDSNVSNGGDSHFLNGEWNDGNAMGWTIEEVADGVYTISNGTQFLAAGDNDVVSLVADATSETAKWTVTTKENRLASLATATAEAPINATFLITDANFGRNDLRKSAWTVSNDCTNKNLSGGNNINNCAESFHSVFTISQTLKNAPKGVYKMTAQGFYRQDETITGKDAEDKDIKEMILEAIPTFFANEETSEFLAKTGSENSMSAASESFSAGLYTINPIYVELNENEDLVIGVKGTAQNQWVIFDNFELTYYGTNKTLTEIKFGSLVADFNTALAAAKAVNQEAKMNASVLEALKNAIQENDGKTFDTTAKYENAINALKTATENANNSIAIYAVIKEYFDKAATLDTDGQTSFANNATVSAVKSAYESNTFESLTNEQVTAMDAALKTAVKAQTTEGADMTLAIVNPSFETGNTTGWTYETSADHGAKANSNPTYTINNADGNYVFNIWSSGNLISQTIEGLPMGSYKLKVLIATDANHQVQISANGKTKKIDAIDKATGVEGEVEFDVLDGKATIGAEGVDKYWYKVDNFRLIFVKAIDLEGLVANYKAALSEAQKIDQEAPMNNDVKSALTTALGKYSSVSETDVDALTEAAIALENAVEKAKASITAYAGANISAYLTKMKGVLDNTNVYTTEAYNKWYANVETNFTNGLYTDEEVASLTENGAYSDGWHSSNRVDDVLLSAWSIDNVPCSEYTLPLYINTWSIEGNNDGSKFFAPFFEYWTGDGNSLDAKTLTATMTADPGIYNVSAWVRVRAKNGYTAPAYGIAMQANEGKAVNVAAGDQVGTSQFYLKEFKARGIVGEDGKLYIKFIVAADNNISWLSFQNVKFAKVETEEVAVTDAKYATFVSDLSLDFTGKDIKAYTAKVSGNKVVLSPINKVAANTPVVLYAEDAAKDNIPLLSGDADDATDNELIAGEATSDGTFYVLANKDKGVGFYKLNADQKVPAGKAYLKIAANTREFYGFGETTGIETVKTVKAENGIFNLQGQRLVKAQKGLNIINGKKAMVK